MSIERQGICSSWGQLPCVCQHTCVCVCVSVCVCVLQIWPTKNVRQRVEHLSFRVFQSSCSCFCFSFFFSFFSLWFDSSFIYGFVVSSICVHCIPRIISHGAFESWESLFCDRFFYSTFVVVVAFFIIFTYAFCSHIQWVERTMSRRWIAQYVFLPFFVFFFSFSFIGYYIWKVEK